MQFHKTENNNDAQTNQPNGRSVEVREETKGGTEKSCESAGETMAEKDCGVYAFRCMTDGRFYVGSSKRIGVRRKHHIISVRGNSSNFFHRKFREIGESRFIFGVLEYCAEESRLLREKFWIEKLNAVAGGFNTQADPSIGYDYNVSAITRTLRSISLRGKKRSPEICLKMSLSAKKRPEPTLATRAKLSAALKLRKRKPHTDEARAKMSAWQSGNKKAPFSDEHRARMSESAKHRSEEHRANLTAALRGRKMPPRAAEAIRKTAEKNRGRKRTHEARQRMREGRARANAFKRAALIKGVIAAPVADEKALPEPTPETTLTA